MKFLAPLLAALLALVPVTDLRSEVDRVRGDHLPTDSVIAHIAAIRAAEISVKFSHTRPDGSNVFALFPADYPWRVAGEIIAWNNYPDSLTAAGAVQGWLDSPGHRAVLLGTWNRVGLGVYQTSSGAHYYVAIFAVVDTNRHEGNVVPVPAPTHTAAPSPPAYRGPTITLPPTDTE